MSNYCDCYCHYQTGLESIEHACCKRCNRLKGQGQRYGGWVVFMIAIILFSLWLDRQAESAEASINYKANYKDGVWISEPQEKVQDPERQMREFGEGWHLCSQG